MLRLTKWLLPLFIFGLLVTFAQAQPAPTVLGTEDAASGFTGVISGSNPALGVASDGESPFHPFGITANVSDAIQLNSNWAEAPGYIGAWTRLLDVTGAPTYTWYLPAVTSCGGENEPACEAIGKWYFTAGGAWPNPGTQYIYESDGSTISDTIILANDGPSVEGAPGPATITFISDPISSVPEPATLLLYGLGFAGAGLYRRMRRKVQK